MSLRVNHQNDKIGGDPDANQISECVYEDGLRGEGLSGVVERALHLNESPKQPISPR
jgi:hypothetical protein